MSEILTLIGDMVSDLPPDTRAMLADFVRGEPEAVAVVGMGCRFPGGADSPEAFWRVLEQGVDAITEVPPERWDIDAIVDPTSDPEERSCRRWGGFLERVDAFDPHFFGISPREAATMDPQQRLLLEVTWEALERAGLPQSKLAGSPTGVFVGVCNADYAFLQADGKHDIHSVLGTANSVVAGRLAFLLDLQGPAITLDTACSSSLVAVHLACQSLRDRGCDVAIAGGVNLILSARSMWISSKLKALSPDGRCRTFDARANGFVRSEGCGVVVLKRLEDALAAKDNVLAVIRGSAVNQDGRSTALTAPNVLSQQALIRKALQSAKLEPADVSYVEAHGSGTPLGDPIEMEALEETYGKGRTPDRACLVGAVKTNIGHPEAAAGIAGLIKTVLAIQHGVIPRVLHLQQVNPRISQDGGIRIATKRTPWEGRRIAGVSAFGISGTNAHVIVEEPPQVDPEVAQDAPRESAASGLLLPLSARDPKALGELAARMAAQLEEGAASLHDVCFTAGVRRTHHDHRVAIVGREPGEIAAALKAFSEGQLPAGACAGTAPAGRERKVVFVFPGQGSQWVGMGRQLFQSEPAFHEAIVQCDAAMRPHVDFSLVELMEREPAPLSGIDVIQPVIFAMQVALAAMFRAYGVKPSAVVGHSMGEVAASCVAGALSLEDAALIICRRSRLLKQVSGKGAMLATELTMAEAAEAIRGHEDRVSIAVSNGARSTVVSGDPTALADIAASLEHKEIFCRWVKVDVASHSPQMDPLLPELLRQTANIRPRPASVPICSTVTGAEIRGAELDAAYWAKNLRAPVLFSTAVGRVAEEGSDVFVEISPHPILLPAIEQELRPKSDSLVVVAAMRREEDERLNMLGGLAALYAAGCSIDFGRLYPEGGRLVELPAYPFQRERLWVDAPAPRRRGAGHPLLGEHMELASQPGAHVWEIDLGVELVPFLADHEVDGAAVLPATAYAEMALAAARLVWAGEEGERSVIEDLELVTLMAVGAEQPVRAQLSVVARAGGASFQIASRAGDGGAWVVHARGTLRGRDGSPPRLTVAEVQARCVESVTAASFYRTMEARGIGYGASFRGVQEVWRGEGEALGRLGIPDRVRAELGVYRMHPALLDAALQVLGAATPGEDSYLPASVRSLAVFGDPAHARWAHARLSSAPRGDMLEGDVLLLDETGTAIAQVSGLRVKRLSRGAAPGLEIDQLLYEVAWREQPLPPAKDRRSPGKWLVLADRGGAGKQLAARLTHAGEPCAVAFVGDGGYERVEPGVYRISPSRPDDFRRLLSEAFGDGVPCRGVAHLWGLDSSRESVAALGCGSVLHLVQALAQVGLREPPRLWLVTRGVQSPALASTSASPSDEAVESINAWQSTLWGFGRTLRYEHPELRCTSIDIGVAHAELDALALELGADDVEDEIALRGASRWVSRLARSAPSLDTPLPRETPSPSPVQGRAFRLETTKPGVLDHLVLREVQRRPPGQGEVEIEVAAASLNFIDVLQAMGIYPGQEPGKEIFGGECAGTIVAVGPGVTELAVGDAVVAVMPGSMGAYVTAPVTRVLRRPASLSTEEAAAVPLVFMTAHYGLNHLARLRPGERVLIHSAAGGTGLAAVQIAMRMGAEVFATVGSEEKRELLRSLGVEHIMSSRTLAFADEIMAKTAGRGVDVVLNSLSGEAIAKGLSCLSPYGRFIDLSKRDIYQDAPLGLSPFRRSLAYFAVDLAGMASDRPDLFQTLFTEVMAAFDESRAKLLLPVRSFPFSDVVGAFHTMAQAQHVGKIVIRREDEPLSILPAARSGASLRADATYLVTGGLGGLGLAVSRWLVDRGARNLALVSRSANAAAEPALEEMRAAGANVHTFQADVSDAAQVLRLFEDVDRLMPPIRGVIHSAVVLDDGIVLKLDERRIASVLAPKVQGSWNLHSATENRPLDFFVLFSSAASLFGSPGQAHYAAGNAFLDALAHHRRARGLPALSINWGAWAEVGQAAKGDRGERLETRGMSGLRTAEALQVFERILSHRNPQIAAMRLDLRQWLELHPSAARSPFFSALSTEQGEAQASRGSAVREELFREAPERRRALLESHLREQIARVLRLDPSRIDVNQRLGALGLDSLMGLEIRNRLEASLGLSLPATLVWTHPTIAALSTHLARKMDLPLEEAAAPVTPTTEASAPADGGELDGLSPDELTALLANELAAVRGGDTR